MQCRACACRTTLVTASRMIRAATLSRAGDMVNSVASDSTATPALSSADFARCNSSHNLYVLYPRRVLRMSAIASRETFSISAISFFAFAGSISSSFPASVDFTMINESVCPSTSCRSRAIRSRSATFARCSISSCAMRSFTFARFFSAKKILEVPTPRGTIVAGTQNADGA